MTPKEINQKYPVRCDAWSFDDVTERWVAEDSTLRDAENEPMFVDPWERMLPINCRHLYGSTDEVIGWVYKTTVAGNPIECVVFND